MSYATQIFQDASSRRQMYPLAGGGEYKISEARFWLQRASENVDLLMRYHRTRIGSKCFICCCWDDKAGWLRRALLDIPFRLGYEVVPAIQVLDYDGVLPMDLCVIESWAKNRIPLIHQRIDAAHTQISNNIKSEYALWDVGDSIVKPELDRAVIFCNDLLGLVELLRSLQEVNENNYFPS